MPSKAKPIPSLSGYHSLSLLENASPIRILAEMRDGKLSRVQKTDPSTFYLAPQKEPAIRLFEGLKTVLRLVTKVIYLSPILLILKLGTRILGPPFAGYGDYLVPLFVVLVVFFFLLFSLTVLMHLVVGPRAKRKNTQAFQVPSEELFATGVQQIAKGKLPLTSDSALESIAKFGMAESGLRLRGTLEALDDGDHRNLSALVSDHWWPKHNKKAKVCAHFRLFSARPLALVREGAPPVALVFEAPPWLACSYDDSLCTFANEDHCRSVIQHASGAHNLGQQMRKDLAYPHFLAPPNDLHGGPCLLLKVGDEVEVVGLKAAPLDPSSQLGQRAMALHGQHDTDDENAGSPYRQLPDQAPIQLLCTLETPILIRRLKRGVAV